MKQDNSGPAFPERDFNYEWDQEKSKSVYTLGVSVHGLTHRQWLVGLAMKAILSSNSGYPKNPEFVAMESHRQADGILKYELEEK